MISSTSPTCHRLVIATSRVIKALVVVGVVGACKAVELPIQSHLPAQIVAVTYPPVSALVKSQVATRPAVRVLDQFGVPVANMTLEFVVTAGEGQVDSPTAQTDAQGLVSVGWSIGPKATINKLEIRFAYLRPLEFQVKGTPGPVAKLQPARGDLQAGPPGTTLPSTLGVRVLDSYDNPISGVPVSFSVSTGGGTIEVATGTSDSEGVADAGRWTLGATAGTQRILARVAQGGAPSTELTAQAHVCTTGDPSLWCAVDRSIVFVRRSDGQIHRMNIDGSNLTTLTITGDHRSPVVSPDGRRIAFARTLPGGASDIYVMNVDGSNVVRRTSDVRFFYGISWAPDNRRLVVAEFGPTAAVHVLSADDDGTAPMKIATDARTPAWSPDGSLIAFVQPSAGDANDALGVMKPDGSGRTLLSPTSGFRNSVSWSRDGRVASMMCATGECTLLTMNTDGTGARALPIPVGIWNASMSRDGLYLAFAGTSTMTTSIELLSLDGKEKRSLSVDGFDVSWVP